MNLSILALARGLALVVTVLELVGSLAACKTLASNQVGRGIVRVAKVTTGVRRRLGKVLFYPDKSETYAGSREWPHTERASAAYAFCVG